MQYVLIQNGYVINGPRNWNYRSFESTLEEDCEITYQLPMSYDSATPIEIAEGIRILPAELQPHGFNPKIEYLHGPFWTFDNDLAVGTYQTVSHSVEAVQNNLKSHIANNRYNTEIAGVKATVQGQEVTVDTSRDGRNIFVLKYVLMGDNDTVEWKFPECWLTLTKTDLGIVVSAGANHIQSAFEWEASKIAEIDACTTLEALDAVDLGDAVPQQPLI
jgi:hypothetical protein